jgi:hypothetical protein
MPVIKMTRAGNGTKSGTILIKSSFAGEIKWLPDVKRKRATTAYLAQFLKSPSVGTPNRPRTARIRKTITMIISVMNILTNVTIGCTFLPIRVSILY